MAATGRRGDKTKSLGFDWPNAEETRQIHSKDNHRVDPTREAQERETPTHLKTYKEWQSWRRDSSGGWK